MGGTNASSSSGGSSGAGTSAPAGVDLATAIGDAPIWQYGIDFINAVDAALDPYDQPIKAVSGAIAGNQNVQDFVEGLTLGSFSENDSNAALAGQFVGGLLPGYGKVADFRDLVAAVVHCYEGKEGSAMELAMASLAFWDGPGDWAKAMWRAGRRLGKESAQQAAQTAARKSLKNAIGEGAQGGSRHAMQGASDAADATTGAAKRIDDGVEGALKEEAGAAKNATNRVTQETKGSLECFPAGTLVATINGRRAIETIQRGDQVWAYDLIASDWSLRPVSETHAPRYNGDLTLIAVGGETIESTALHPYWVVSGAGLVDRPRLVHLDIVPDGATTPGRWVDARDVCVGDELLLIDGRTEMVQAVGRRPYADKVYNFEVRGLHCYAVGENGVLVHNENGDGYHGPKSEYTNPGTHDQTSPHYVRGKTPLPADAEAVYRRAIPDPAATNATKQTWYGRSADGSYYRYQGTNGEVHFNAIVSWNNLPAYIRQRFRDQGFGA